MSKTDYPTATELRVRMAQLEDADFTIPADFSYADAIEAAVAAWESDTGWTPFKATTRTEYYDAPGSRSNSLLTLNGGGKVLNLRNSILSVTSVVVDGVTKTINDDFYLLKKPGKDHCDLIRFTFPVFSRPNGIVVTGTWGYQTTGIPADVWEAVMCRAMMGSADVLIQQLTGGIEKWEEGNAGEVYGENPFANQIKVWRANWASATSRYKRIASWL